MAEVAWLLARTLTEEWPLVVRPCLVAVAFVVVVACHGACYYLGC